MVTTCICLQNLCVIYQDKFDEEWPKEGERTIYIKSRNQVGFLQNSNIFRAGIQGAKETKRYLIIKEVETGDMLIEDFEGTKVNDNDGIEEEEELNAKIVETKTRKLGLKISLYKQYKYLNY